MFILHMHIGIYQQKRQCPDRIEISRAVLEYGQSGSRKQQKGDQPEIMFLESDIGMNGDQDHHEHHLDHHNAFVGGEESSRKNAVIRADRIDPACIQIDQIEQHHHCRKNIDRIQQH